LSNSVNRNLSILRTYSGGAVLEYLVKPEISANNMDISLNSSVSANFLDGFSWNYNKIYLNIYRKIYYMGRKKVF